MLVHSAVRTLFIKGEGKTRSSFCEEPIVLFVWIAPMSDIIRSSIWLSCTLVSGGRCEISWSTSQLLSCASLCCLDDQVTCDFLRLWLCSWLTFVELTFNKHDNLPYQFKLEQRPTSLDVLTVCVLLLLTSRQSHCLQRLATRTLFSSTTLLLLVFLPSHQRLSATISKQT